MGAYKRGSSWVISYFVNGKRKRETIGPSKREAELVLAKRRAEVREGKYFDVKKAGNVTFQKVAERYMAEYARHYKAPSSIRNDESKMKRLLAAFGDWKLKELDADSIGSYLAQRLEDGKSKATVNRDRALLSHIFTMAVRWRLCPSNPVRLIRPHRENNQRARFLTATEVSQLVAKCRSWLRPIVLTATHTGMRKEEILSLTWEQVNSKARTIRLSKTKTGHSRVLPINDELWEVLSSLPRRLHSPYVFAKADGSRYHADGLKRAFSKALEGAEIEDFRFHDLRHTAASNLVMAGVDLFTVSKILGHRTLEMTQRYSHLSPSHLSEAAQKLGTALRKGGEAKKSETRANA